MILPVLARARTEDADVWHEVSLILCNTKLTRDISYGSTWIHNHVYLRTSRVSKRVGIKCVIWE